MRRCVRSFFCLIFSALFLLAPESVGAHSTLGAAASKNSSLQTIVEEYAASHLPRGGVVLGIARDEQVEWYSTRGLDPYTPVEIGSITKAITGMWLAAEIEAGSLTPETTVGSLWPSGTEAQRLGISEPPSMLAEATLEQLATHTSGLPRLHMGVRTLTRVVLRADNPYRGLGAAAVYRDALSANLSDTGSFHYSNLAYALLGQLLLSNAGYDDPSSADYEREVEAAVLSPLGVSGFSTGRVAEMAIPYAANGRRASAWDFDGYVAAGGLVSSPRALMELTRSIAALPPAFDRASTRRAAASGGRWVGYGWFIESLEDGTSMIWHNGGTGGFRTFVGSVPERGLAVVAAANAAVSVEELARAAITGSVPPSPPAQPPPFNWIVGVAFLVLPVLFVVSRVAESVLGLAIRRKHPPEIAGSVSGVAESAFLIGVWASAAPAELYTPGSEYVLLAAVTVATAVELYRARRQSRLTFSRPGSSRLHTAGRVTYVAALVTVTVLIW